jgi:nitroreductase
MKATSSVEYSNERPLSKAVQERRATPSFDNSPVPDDVLSTIIKAGMQAPSGYNLQPWRFIVVRSPEQKQRLCEAALGQPKVEQAGAVIVCCGDLNAPRGKSLEDIFSQEQNQRTKARVSKTFSEPAGDFMGVAPDYAVWVNRHVMISFTTMMWTAETLGYDTAPMEGFSEDKVKTVLGIPAHVRVVALLAIGKLKGPDKPYAGRRDMHDVCFVEKWEEKINF